MKNIIAFGDIILDKYIYCTPKKINSEYPNLVFEEKNIRFQLGGVCNVSSNLSSLNNKIFLLSLSNMNDTLINLLLEKNINIDFLIKNNNYNYIITRYISNNNQVFRIDNNNILKNMDSQTELKIIKNFNKIIANQHIDGLIISDYNKGVVSTNVCTKLISICKESNIPIFVDPKINDFYKFKDSTLLKPNRLEFEKICHSLNLENKTNKNNLKKVCEMLNLENILVTLDKDGMIIYNHYMDKIKIFKSTENIKLINVTGAGDIVLASFIHFYFKNYNIFEIVKLTKKLSEYSVSIMDNFQLNLNIVDRLCFGSKLISEENFHLINKNSKIVFTNGCFDIIHTGHIEYLKKSKDLGDILIIGLNSDESIKRIKGSNRPINKQFDRIKILESFYFVDYIIIFEDDTPYKLIKKLKPDILVKGGDYKIEDMIGKDLVEEVKIIDFVEGYSTTKFINSLSNK